MFLVLAKCDDEVCRVRDCVGYLSLYSGNKSTNGGYGGVSRYFDELAN